MTLRLRLTLAVALLVLAAPTLDGQNPPPPLPSPPSRPSFVFILGEGQGFPSASVAMDDALPDARRPAGLTPHLEALARDGLRIPAFYAGCPRCTPSRASFLTGISPAALHMTFGNDGGERRGRRGEEAGADPEVRKFVPPEPLREIPDEVTTIAELLRAAGYATAHFGKWHVGRRDPKEHGFDASDGPTSNVGPGGNRTPNPAEAAAITERALAFARRAKEGGKPFYVQISHYGGAGEDEATPEARARVASLMSAGRGKELGQAAVMVDMDTAIGRLLRGLDDLGLTGATYVVLSADHGSPGGNAAGSRRRQAGPNAPLKGGKGSVHEGGVRIPFIIRGPGIRPGSIAPARAIGFDLAPTFADLAGIKALPNGTEGGSLVPLFSDPKNAVVRRPREELVIHFPHYDLDNGGPASALYLGPYKLLRSYETGQDHLYEITKDPGETTDLAAARPEVAADLGKRLDAYLRDVRAQMPVPATKHPPAPPVEEPKRRRKV